MTFKSKILVLGTNEWKMEEEKKEGVSVFYVSDSGVQETNKRGYFPIKKSMTRELASPLFGVQFPQLCEVEFALVATVGNKMDFDIKKITPIREVNEIWK